MQKRLPGPGRLLLFGDQLYCIPREMPDFDGLRVIRPGLHLGTVKKGRFEPSHALALALKGCQVKKAIRLEPEGRELLTISQARLWRRMTMGEAGW